MPGCHRCRRIESAGVLTALLAALATSGCESCAPDCDALTGGHTYLAVRLDGIDRTSGLSWLRICVASECTDLEIRTDDLHGICSATRLAPAGTEVVTDRCSYQRLDQRTWLDVYHREFPLSDVGPHKVSVDAKDSAGQTLMTGAKAVLFVIANPDGCDVDPDDFSGKVEFTR